MIQIDISGQNLAIKILKGPDFRADKDRLSKISGKMPLYEIDSEGDSVFKHWEVSKTGLGDLLRFWEPQELLFTEKARPLYEAALTEAAPLEGNELPESVLEGVLRQPRPWQKRYILLSNAKRKLISAMDVGAGKSLASLLRSLAITPKGGSNSGTKIEYTQGQPVNSLSEEDSFQETIVRCPLKIGPHFRLLVICPKTCIKNWQTEIRLTYGADSFRYWALGGKRKELDKQVGSAQIVVTSYQMAKFLNYKADHIIVDEAHLIKNEQTDRYKAVARLIKQNPDASLQLLTGTPIYNRVRDLYTLLKLVAPTLAGSRGAFLRQYEKVKRYKKIRKSFPSGKFCFIKVPIATEEINQEELHAKISSVLYRVNKSDLITYEDVTDYIDIEMGPRQARMYKMEVEDLIRKTEERVGMEEILPALTRLRMLAEGAYLVSDYPDSGKMDYVCEYLDNIEEDEKVVVWSCFQKGTNLLYEKYKDRSVLFNGSVPDSRKQLSLWAFQGCDTEEDLQEYRRLNALPSNRDFLFNPMDAQILFGVINAVSSIGINLHRANKQIILSCDPLYTTMEQAMARIKRIGQAAPTVNTKILFSDGTNERIRFIKSLERFKNQTRIIDGKRSSVYDDIQEQLEELRDLL